MPRRANLRLDEEVATLRERVAALEADNRRHAARAAITDCIFRFCRALDRLDRELLASVFHPDAELDYGAIYRGGVDGFLDAAMAFQASMRDTQHHVGNILVRLDGERATAESYVYAHHVLVEGGALHELIVGARYLDRFEARGGEWRMTHRAEVLDWGRLVPITESWFERNTRLPRGTRNDHDPSRVRLDW
jgi:hypothetical protein